MEKTAPSATMREMLVMPVAVSAYASGSAELPSCLYGTMPVSTKPTMM